MRSSLSLAGECSVLRDDGCVSVLLVDDRPRRGATPKRGMKPMPTGSLSEGDAGTDTRDRPVLFARLGAGNTSCCGAKPLTRPLLAESSESAAGREK